MTRALNHRGPDAGGVWSDQEAGIALGHRRLAIIDLSETGRQPMISASGRYVLTYNGEIYNFRELRHGLERDGYSFRGHSDSEVILAAAEVYGFPYLISYLQGMFAFAIWDRIQRRLLLARDRAGKKPLYYGWVGHSFVFASELKAIRRYPDFNAAIDHDALGQYLQYGWVATPNAIYRNIRTLPAGHYLILDATRGCSEEHPRIYWSARDSLRHSRKTGFQGSFSEAVSRLDETLLAAVRDRMVADVPLGALLSGGIDSSLIVAMMQRLSGQPIKTFSIGFQEERYNEAEYAARVAHCLGTEHHELYVSPQEALNVVEHLPEIYDEPFADASQIPTYLVCKLARENVKVVLTGDGGDEQFAGYRRYKNCLKQWRSIQRIPKSLREGVAFCTKFAGMRAWWILERMNEEARARVAPHLRGIAKSYMRSCSWRARYPQQILANKFSHCLPVDALVKDAQCTPTVMSDPAVWETEQGVFHALLHYDYIGYLANDILVKIDRASMANSLEARAPLLDQRVLEFAWSLPVRFLFDGKQGKLVLKELLYQYVPRSLVDRPKQGFSVPIKEWLVGPLREWATDLLADGLVRRQGLFEPRAIQKIWRQHICGWYNHAELLWAILMFQSWWLKYEDSRCSR